MLRNIEFIGDGKPWPPKDEDEEKRIAEHVMMRKVYNGLHDEIFQRYAAYLADKTEGEADKPKIILDWPDIATSTYTNMVFGKKIEIKSTMENIPKTPDSQVVIDSSRYGHGLYEVCNEGISVINPENVYLVVSPANLQVITHFVIFSKFEVEATDQEKKRGYIKFTIHSKGQIQHKIFELLGGKLVGQLSLQDFPEFAGIVTDDDGIQKTGIDEILIVHVQNTLTSERYYGRSDYTPSVISLIESLEISFAQRDEVQSQFTKPTPVIPDSALSFDFGAGEWTFRAGEPIITMPGDVPPSLMVWDAQLAHVEKAIDQKMDQLLQHLHLSKVLLAGTEAGTAESGTALRFRLIPTMSVVDKHRLAMEEAIPQVLHLWSALHKPVVEKNKISVILRDGLPTDPIETATATQIWASISAISLERKLEMQGLKPGTDAFNDEIARLRPSGMQGAAVLEPIIKLQPRANA